MPADEETYQDMIRALNKFASEVKTKAANVSGLVDDCVANMHDDVNMKGAAGKVENAISKIQAQANEAISTALKLQEEWRKIEESRSVMESSID